MAAKSSAAAYRPEKMIIRLSSILPIIDADGRPIELPTANAFGVFLHEYFHYIHNVSTSVGLAGFINTLEIWRLLRTTIDENGFSEGHQRLDGAYYEHYRNLYCLFRSIRTVYRPNLKSTGEVTSIEVSSADICDNVQSSEHGVLLSLIKCRAKLEISDGSTEFHDIEVGVQEIMESSAWLLERRYVNSSDPYAADLPVDVFPYKVVSALAKYVLKNPDHDSILACSLAALHSTNPAEALIDILNIAKNAETTGGNAINDVQAAVNRIVEANHAQLIKALEDIEGEFCGDSIMATGVLTITLHARIALELRRQKPLFEIDFVDLLAKDGAALDCIMSKVPACNVLQENAGPIGNMKRDFLVSFRQKSDDNVDPEAGLRVVHAAFDFALRHFSESGFLNTETLSHKSCPFFTTCDLALRKNESDICEKKPWESVDWDGWGNNGRCEYAEAISNTRPPSSS